MTDDDTLTATRRTVLKTGPALIGTTVAASTAAVASSIELSPLVETAGGVMGWSEPDGVETVSYGDVQRGFHVGYSEGDTDTADAIADWVAKGDDRQVLRSHPDWGVDHIAAPPVEVGVAGIQALQSGTLVESVAGIQWLDAIQTVSLVEPVTPVQSPALELPRRQQFALGVTSASGSDVAAGLATSDDMEQSTPADSRSALNTSAASADTGGLTVAVVDTGATDGAIFEDPLGDSRLLTASKNTLTDETGRSAVEDGNGHGNWCCEMIVGRSSDSALEGFAPAADLLAMKALGDDGSGDTMAVGDAIRYAADQGADLTNASLGGPYSLAIERAVSYSRGAGTIVIAAAGNARYQGRYVGHPASSPETIAVAATTAQPAADAKVAYFSSPGPQPGTTDLSNGATAGYQPDVAAPGAEIETARQGHKSGTSMAAPAVTGAILRLMAEDGSLQDDPDAIETRITEFATPAPNAGVTDTQHGMADVERALDESSADETQAEARSATAEARDLANRRRADAYGAAVTRWFS
jgi:hypothetical protein